MNDMLNSLEGFDSGSNYKFGDKMLKSKNPRSLFDLSHLNTLTIPNAGMLVPIGLWETLPGDDHDISVDCLLRVMPQVVPLYSRQRMYIYAFYSRYSDLWNNWQVFIDKGYTGNVQKSIPVLQTGKNFNTTNIATDTIGADTIFDYMGLPIGVSKQSLFGADSSATIFAHISALPFMMYLRIYRDYFMNKNEWIEDRVMLPDDDSRFRLDDDGKLLSAKDQSKTFYFTDDDDISISSNTYKCGMLYHDYPDDYFTSALPFTQRGATPKLDYKVDLSQIGLDFSDSTFSHNIGSSFSANVGTSNGITIPFAINGGNSVISAFENSMKTQLGKAKFSGSNIGLEIILEDLRKLAIAQIELEQLARTDGSYKQFGLSFFGESSKAAYDFRPIYIGGTYKNIAFTEVLQTAGSTVPTTASTGNSPLGAYAGHGITGITNGRIGHIHCDDYGMIMLIACIMPDIYYSQGLERIFTDSLQSEKFLPDRARLGMQPILNKELYYAGNNGADEGDDNYLWAYQNPFDWLRYIPNHIHGKIADSNNRSFFPFTQSRKFTQLPNWGRSFSEAKDVRKDYLFAPSEDAYSAQFSINVRSVRPLPYKPVPAQIIN